MLNRTTAHLLAAIAIGLSFNASAQTLWQKASFGMTVAQVTFAFPKATSVRDGDALNTGAKELLRESGVVLGGSEFEAQFFFNNQKLEQVTLKATEPRQFELMISTFEQMRTLLRARYGRELSSSIKSEPLLSKAEADWVVGKTNVSLFLLGIGQNPAVLNINYQVRMAKDAERL